MELNKDNEENKAEAVKSSTAVYATVSLVLSIAALVCNIVYVNYDGAPLGVAFALMGIGFAIASKETSDNYRIEGRAKGGLILSIIALVFGLLLYVIQLITMQVMTDPKLSRQVLTELEKMIARMPENMRPSIEEVLAPFK